MSTPTQLADVTWMLVTAALVMLMQAGFCCLESGLARAKNSINVAIKNLADFCLASVLFWLWGFGLMFGADAWGMIGTSHFLVSGESGSWLLAFFLFQLVFCGTSTTIVSGAVAERMTFRGYLFISAIVSGVIYPVVGHWVWGGVVPGTGKGWLAELGFIDFAGSTVVHSVGGWVSLMAVLLIGPRLGRFTGGLQQIHGHNYPLAVLGTMLLWFGWFGFNGGSTLAVNESIPLILVNTNLSAAAGGMSAILFSVWIRGRADVGDIMNGAIAGLVGITAGCHLMSPAASIAIGATAGMLCLLATLLLERCQVDDVVGAFPVHAVCGMWGTLAVALLADPAKFGTGLSRWEQFTVQLIGVGSCGAWSCGAALLLIGGFSLVCRFRVSREHEIQGLNFAEHGASTELIDLLSEMQHQSEAADFSRAVHVEPHTEVGQIAHQYNRVLHKVVHEIDRREELVDQLRVAEEKYRSIFHNSTEGIFRISARGRVFDVNPALANIAGYSDPLSLVADVPDFRACVGNGKATWEQLLEQLEDVGVLTGFETTLRRKDGTSVDVSINARLHQEGADAAQIVEGSIADITQRKQAERFRQEKEAAEAASRAKSSFLATMSHEIRTPLNGVIGMLDLLATSPLNSQQARYTSIGKSSAHALLSLINDILDFSKIESGKLELNPQEFSPGTLIEEIVEMFAHKTEQKGLELYCHVRREVPERLIGDDERIRQILINLLGNAIKFTEAGQVGIDVRCIAAEGGKSRLRFEVKDTGAGIPDDVKPRLFQVFEQADSSTTRKYGGTGLGLAICRQLVELMGGRIGLDSRVGIGSTFWCEIPFAAAPPRKSSRLPVRGVQGLRVLAVDDNEINLEILQSQMTDWQAVIQTADSANSALEALRLAAQRGSPVELLLLDHQMPELDGLDLVRMIRADASLPAPVIIMLTSSDCVGTAESLEKLGISACCQKPILRSRLFDVLMTTLHHRGSRQSAEPGRPLPKAGQPRAQPLRGRRVLIVDDNEINRLVAEEILVRNGCACEVAEDGAAALHRLAARSFDIVLMDCQMPVLDGFTAVQEIRRRQPQGELHPDLPQPLPVIALTANAVAGDRERCLAAGMSGYVSKPIDPDVLLSMMGKFLPHSDGTEAIIKEVSPMSASPCSDAEFDDLPDMDWDALRERCGEEESFLDMLLGKFRERLQGDCEQLRGAIADNRPEHCRRVAHALKGAAGNLGALGVAASAADLELLSADSSLDDYRDRLGALESRVNRCLETLDARLAALAR